VRGAFHALARLMAEEGWEAGGGRERGVVTHSSGQSHCPRPSHISGIEINSVNLGTMC
jgi:hypothetical protein